MQDYFSKTFVGGCDLSGNQFISSVIRMEAITDKQAFVYFAVLQQ